MHGDGGRKLSYAVRGCLAAFGGVAVAEWLWKRVWGAILALLGRPPQLSEDQKDPLPCTIIIVIYTGPGQVNSEIFLDPSQDDLHATERADRPETHQAPRSPH